MPDAAGACVLCGADRTTALSSKSGFRRSVCASSVEHLEGDTARVGLTVAARIAEGVEHD